MGRHAVCICFAAAILAACSSSGGRVSESASVSTSSAPPPTVVTTATTDLTTPTTAAPSTTTTSAAVTTTNACPNPAGSTTPVTTPAPHASALLTTVSVTGSACTDRVIFGFLTKSGGTPSCSAAYKTGPFNADASGALVKIAGGAFVFVRCSPAYGYDFESGRTTYTGPKRIDAKGRRHVREVVETGDFEGVVSWVVALDSQRPFRVSTATIPPGVSTVAIDFS